MPEWDMDLRSDVRKRILRTANHEATERPPLWEHLANERVFKYFQKAEESPHKTMSRAYRQLGIDVCRGYTLPSTWTKRGDNEDENLSLDDLKRECEGSSYSDRGCSEFYESLMQEYRETQRMLAPHTLYVPTVGTGLTDLYVSVGYERFCVLLKDEPELVRHLLRRRLKNNLGWVKFAASHRLCPLFLVAEDIGFNSGLMFSPSLLRSCFLPALVDLIEPLKEEEIKVVFHSDGNIMKILPELVDTGIDGLHPIEPSAGMDIGQVKKEFGDQLFVVGNVDATGVLRKGTPEAIRQAVQECHGATGGKGHFVGSSGEIGPDVPLENVFALCESCQALRNE